MPVPELNNEEHLTREHFIELFIHSEFYKRLKGGI
jgi:hypothetical protein